MILNSKWTLSLTFVTLLGLSCKKQTQLPMPQIAQNAETSSILYEQENPVYAIVEPRGYTVLNVVERNRKIFIKNRHPGFGLSYNKGQYIIIDKHGKKFTFSSQTVLAEISDTGLMDEIQILKDGKERFSNRRY